MDLKLQRRYEIDLGASQMQMDDKISALQTQLDKGIHEVITLINQKYVDFMPQTMFLNVGFPVTQVIAKAKAALSDASLVAEDANRQLSTMDDSLRLKIKAVNDILSNLENIKELEILFEGINTDEMDDPVKLAHTILNAEHHLKLLAGKNVYEPLQKALPVLTEAFAFRKGDIVRRLKQNFSDLNPAAVGDSMLQLTSGHSYSCAKEIDAMKLLGIWEESPPIFADVVPDPVDARILEARDLIFTSSVCIVEVGTSENEQDDSPAQFFKEFQMNTNIRGPEFPDNSCLPKLLQFNKCKVSQAIYDLGELLVDTLEAAGKTDDEVAARKLLTTANNIVKLFLMSAAKHHHEAIQTLPMNAGLFYNGCYYLGHMIMMASLRLQSNVVNKWPALKLQCDFTSYLVDLRQQAADAMEGHLLIVRRHITSLLVSNNVFINLGSAIDRKECHRIVDECIHQVQQVAAIWKDVLTDAVYVQAVGSLVSFVLSTFTNMVLKKEDVIEMEANAIEDELAGMLKIFEEVMKIHGQSGIQTFCEFDYHRTKEIIFCLKESLLNIFDRWCDGKGLLAQWLNADEVKHLIRALFQNTERRARILENIN